MASRETNIEKWIRARALKMGGLALKFVSPGFSGVPDRMILLPQATIVFIETKTTGKDLSPRQKYVKKQFEELGFKVYKIDTIDQAKKILDEVYS